MPRQLDTLSPSQPEHMKCRCYPCLAPLSPSPTVGSRGTCHFQVDPTRQLCLPAPAPGWETARQTTLLRPCAGAPPWPELHRPAPGCGTHHRLGTAFTPSSPEQLLPMRAPQRVSHHLGLPLRALARPRRSCSHALG